MPCLFLSMALFLFKQLFYFRIKKIPNKKPINPPPINPVPINPVPINPVPINPLFKAGCAAAGLQDFTNFLHRWNFIPNPVDVRQWIDARPLEAVLAKLKQAA